MKISVIICTHNPRVDYLRRTLEALEKQTYSKNNWEFILIDNASEKPLASHWDLSWHPNSRHVHEAELGLTNARIRGISESKGDLLLFVDDDNILHRDYLQRCVDIANSKPSLGCFGAGKLVPEYEVKPEKELLPYTGFLALRSVDKAYWSNDSADLWTPWGAGLVVTRKVAEAQYAKLKESKMSRMLGRKGDVLTSGEDDEFSWTACEMGLGKGIFPELEVIHLIGARRIERDYLLRLAKGSRYSRVILLSIHGQELPNYVPPPSGWRIWKYLLTLKRSKFIEEGSRWWNLRNMPPTDREFILARSEGVKEALLLLGKHNVEREL
ncbi:hypothetical protein NT6N_26670 [Oceaniferula spumae]|uniref:Glycosyltransferase 2-like domain-containing protein n=1 Tax=Oceaniferula spumae TaxID=2979115 RepID=A0AAT9FNC9_9BACT